MDIHDCVIPVVVYNDIPDRPDIFMSSEGVGTIIRHKYVITCAHLFRNFTSVVGIIDGTAIYLNLVAKLDEIDIAVLEFENEIINKMYISLDETNVFIPKKNEHISFVSFLLEDTEVVDRNINGGIIDDITIENLNEKTDNMCKYFTIMPKNIVITVETDDKSVKLSGLSGGPCIMDNRLIGVILSGLDGIINILPICYVYRVLNEIMEKREFGGFASIYIKYKSGRKGKYAYITRDISYNIFKLYSSLISINGKSINHKGYVKCEILNYEIPLETYILLNNYVNDKIIIKTMNNKSNKLIRNKISALRLIENKFINYNNYIFHEINPILFRHHFNSSTVLSGPFSKYLYEYSPNKLYYNQYNRIIVMTDISDSCYDVELVRRMNSRKKIIINEDTFTFKYIPTLKKINNRNITCIEDIEKIIKNAKGKTINFSLQINDDATTVLNIQKMALAEPPHIMSPRPKIQKMSSAEPPHIPRPKIQKMSLAEPHHSSSVGILQPPPMAEPHHSSSVGILQPPPMAEPHHSSSVDILQPPPMAEPHHSSSVDILQPPPMAEPHHSSSVDILQPPPMAEPHHSSSVGISPRPPPIALPEISSLS